MKDSPPKPIPENMLCWLEYWEKGFPLLQQALRDKILYNKGPLANDPVKWQEEKDNEQESTD